MGQELHRGFDGKHRTRVAKCRFLHTGEILAIQILPEQKLQWEGENWASSTEAKEVSSAMHSPVQIQYGCGANTKQGCLGWVYDGYAQTCAVLL